MQLNESAEISFITYLKLFPILPSESVSIIHYQHHGPYRICFSVCVYFSPSHHHNIRCM